MSHIIDPISGMPSSSDAKASRAMPNTTEPQRTKACTVAIFDVVAYAQYLHLTGGIEDTVDLPKNGCELKVSVGRDGAIVSYLIDTRVPARNVPWWYLQIKWKYGTQDPNLSHQIDLPWSLLPDAQLLLPSGIEFIETETPYLRFRLFPDGRKEYLQ